MSAGLCSCPHCGRTGIPFELSDAHTVFECRQCGGKFTPLDGAVAEASEEESPIPEAAYWPDEPAPGPKVKPAFIGAALIGVGILFTCGVAFSILSSLEPAKPPP